MSWIKKVTLIGNHITLIPLTSEHIEGLLEAASDGQLWNIWYASVPSPETMHENIQHALAAELKGTRLPFTVINNKTQQIIGMTTYYNLDAKTKRVDIGSTWYKKSVHKSAVNTECKLLLLTHAFETLKCVAVEFKVSCFNKESIRAVERLGAKLTGIIRNHRFLKNGTLTDSYIFSIINSEWPTIKTHLQWKLDNSTNIKVSNLVNLTEAHN